LARHDALAVADVALSDTKIHARLGDAMIGTVFQYVEDGPGGARSAPVPVLRTQSLTIRS
jgi:hypothetical protein